MQLQVSYQLQTNIIDLPFILNLKSYDDVLQLNDCNLKAQQSLPRLRTSFDDEAPCKATIYNWFAEFKRGRVNLSDEFRDGRPSTCEQQKHRCCAPYNRNKQACNLP
ncbi:hypothetical protein EVAR_29364_1 [Eumeta japonica]|uniref:Mos1 transposase HTH domain-containing protein n=1 Tax=Eumeta variegata TaxID=151549 RepID=A0A4C1WKG5_EUMVA|nr:hypothetical protein EVAR_29364_1 [Eumeta japonica]